MMIHANAQKMLGIKGATADIIMFDTQGVTKLLILIICISII